MSKRKFVRRTASSVFILWLAMAGVSPASDTFTSLASFDKTNGNEPNHTALIQATDGNLYGVTSYGGVNGSGAVFRISPSGTLDAIYSFCAQGGTCPDGQGPYAGLTMDASGKLYGTTSAGGADGWGTVFELTPNATKTKWTERVLHSFCAQGIFSGCPDGQTPYAGLIIDKLGRLYGTTYQGGAHSQGTVFELTPNAAKTTWTETVLYSFCSQGGESCTDGANPNAALIMGARGKLYGTTYQGGASGQCTAFELTATNAAKTEWTETALYSFCAQENCDDGAYPGAALIIDAAGDLYGTTSGGGTGFAGTVFALTPDAKTSWKETVLYSFCAQGAYPNCTDGYSPQAALLMDAWGQLYGTTYQGGANNGGTVFELP